MLNIIEVINNRRNQKGQAAITDALFFLTIIVTLSVLLFKFSSTYGDRIDLATSNLYFKEYSNSAMKTIFYSEVPLDYSLDVDKADEVDYLMTSIKADYFKDGVIGKTPPGPGGNDHLYINEISGEESDIAKYNLYHTIKAVMYPLPTYDYIFYLYNIDLEKFEFVLIKITDFGAETTGTGYISTYNPSSMEPKYYLCDPINYSEIRNLVSKVNRVYASSIPLQFVVGQENRQINNTFATWAATTAIKPADLVNPTTMNCKEINDEQIKIDVSNNPPMP